MEKSRKTCEITTKNALKLLSISSKNSFLRDWRCADRSRTTVTSKMELFEKKFEAVATIVTTRFI